jgi:DNA-binding response OmpR family regulator
MRVLVMAGNQIVLEDISFCLRVRYPEVEIVAGVEANKGIELIESEMPDLCLIDESLPQCNIVTLIKDIRAFSELPLIVLAVKGGDLKHAELLEAGADEYLDNPIRPIELLAVVKALLRRTKGLSLKAEHMFSIGDQLTIDFETHEVRRDGRLIKLTPIEIKILSKMVRNEGRVVSTGVLLESAWGREYATDTGFVKKYINRLRNKLEEDPRNPKLFITERGMGYKFVRPL